jgi:hypothetical protein
MKHLKLDYAHRKVGTTSRKARKIFEKFVEIA